MSNSSLTGVTSAEVAERTARGMVNRVRRSDAAEYRDIVVRNVVTLFNAMVLPAAAALFLLREYRGAIAVSGFAITNLVLGLIQEIRAKGHLDRLALLVETRVRVVRDGVTTQIFMGDVVQGELLLLTAGEPVVADGPVVESRFLEVDEALLTGESDPVPRRPGDLVLSGSYCVAGEGSYRADRVGAEAFAQKTSTEARAYRFSPSPLQQTINKLIQILTVVALGLCGMYGVFYLIRGFEDKILVEMIAATITATVPQGLVLMVTLAFILGAVRMSSRGALVQRLNAVEAMASIDTLCMDKTGTLTTNQLELEGIHVLGPNLAEEEVRQRLAWFASASIDRQNKSLAALRKALGEVSVQLIDQLPFKSQNRYSALRARSDGKEVVLALGAFESLQFLLEADRTRAESSWQQLMGTGLRLLLFAEATSGPSSFTGTLEGFGLRPLAFVALRDELRPEARRVLELLADQGISFKIISGDNAETVRATVAPLALGASQPALQALISQPVVSGDELESAGPRAADLVASRSVFGRVSPRQKVQIVETLKKQGRQVAMIGDGVNDVLPIKDAHLGIAMGDGSQAAKTVAGLVLETNNFDLLPETLEEGRTIIHNLCREGKLFLTKDTYIPLLIVSTLGVFLLPFPLLPQQVTLLNALTIGLPALILILDRERAATTLRSGFLYEVGWFALRTGIILAVAGLVLLTLAARLWEYDEETQRTLLLSALVPLGLVTFLRLVWDGESRPGRGATGLRWLLAAVCIPIYLVAMYWAPTAYFFELTPLTRAQWGRVLVVVITATVLAWVSDRIFWRVAGRVRLGTRIR